MLKIIMKWAEMRKKDTSDATMLQWVLETHLLKKKLQMRIKEG